MVYNSQNISYYYRWCIYFSFNSYHSNWFKFLTVCLSIYGLLSIIIDTSIFVKYEKKILMTEVWLYICTLFSEQSKFCWEVIATQLTLAILAGEFYMNSFRVWQYKNCKVWKTRWNSILNVSVWRRQVFHNKITML